MAVRGGTLRVASPLPSCGRPLLSLPMQVDVRWGDALQVLPKLSQEGLAGKVELLLLDGVPKEYLACECGSV